MIKRISALVVAGAVACSLLAGCGAQQPTQENAAAVETDAKADEYTGEMSNLASFTAKTADGKDFSQKDLESVDITLVTVWSANSEACKEEMADVAAWTKMLPKSVQAVTFCADYDDGGAQVLKEAGYEGITLVSGDGDYEAFMGQVTQTPTAVVVDSSGKILEEPLVGAPNNLANAYTKLLNQGLTVSGKARINVAA